MYDRTKLKTFHLKRSAKIVKSKNFEKEDTEQSFKHEDFKINFVANYWIESNMSFSGSQLFSNEADNRHFKEMMMNVFWLTILFLVIACLLYCYVSMRTMKKRTTQLIDMTKRRGLFYKHNEETMENEEQDSDEEPEFEKKDMTNYLGSRCKF